MNEETGVVPEETTAPVQEAQTEAPAVEATESAAVETEDTSATEHKSNVQKRIDQLTWRQRETERENQYLRQQIAQSQQQPEQGEPQVDQFSDYDQYIAARAQYEAKRTFESLQAQEREAQQAQQAQVRANQYRLRADQFAATKPDYHEVVSNPYLHITDQMGEVIQSLEKGPELAYHLGNHPEEAERIARLSPVMQAAELGKLEARMTTQKPASITNAPSPVEPVAGGGDSSVKDPENMTMDEFIAWRNANIQR